MAKIKDPKPKLDTSSMLQEVEDLKSKLARALADYSNLEKRFEKESEQVIKFANSSLIRELLPIKDNLERASRLIKDKGLEMVNQDLLDLLKNNQVVEITAKEYDPNTMECEEVVEGEKNQVIEVTQKGYTLQDRVIRPAKVKVGGGTTKK